MTTGGSSSTSSSEEVEVGRVGRPHGLDGSFRVTGAEFDALVTGRRVRVSGRDAEIVRRAGTPARPILRVSGCSSREDAEALRGSPLLMARAELPALEPGEYWAHDLVGSQVHAGERYVGTVVRLLGLPSCEVLEVERAEGGDALLVPLVADAVLAVDLAARRVEVDLAFLGEA